jgi:hypothetical protein
MKRLLVLLIIISVTPWAVGQVDNKAEQWITGNNNDSNQTQNYIANFALTTNNGNGNITSIVQQ